MNGIFHNLQDKAFFANYIVQQYTTAANGFFDLVECSQDLADDRIDYAFNAYQQNIAKFSVLLHSSNPDQYKRAGALLHALAGSKIASNLSFDPCKDEIEAGLTRLHYGDGQYAMTQIDFYEAYHNELLAFDVAYRCCASYEPDPVVPDWDYVQNMCFYLSRNAGRSVDTFFMVFKSLMFRPT